MNADEVENVWHLALSYSSALFILAEILLVQNCAVSEIQCNFQKRCISTMWASDVISWLMLHVHGLFALNNDCCSYNSLIVHTVSDIDISLHPIANGCNIVALLGALLVLIMVCPM